MSDDLRAPFPWFGGKSKIAPQIWAALGDVDNYVEPFAGSLAALLARPAHHAGGIETVNDLDAYIVNFWRALQADPAGVAHHSNNPANETDLTARHIWLVNTGADRLARLSGDPEYYDVQVAGWWVWGICSWIGHGWCSGRGPWIADGEGRLTRTGNAGRGVNRQMVHLGNAGQGVNRQMVHLGSAGNGTATGEAEIYAYLSTLAERLRYVRVCQGDWRRVLRNGALAQGNTIGVFLDPPYATDIRNDDLYNTDQLNGATISGEVRQWAIENGGNPKYWIILAGYEGEHDMPGDWRVIEWSANAAYQRTKNTQSATANSENRHKERLWLSPGCLISKSGGQIRLFDVAGQDERPEF